MELNLKRRKYCSTQYNKLLIANDANWKKCKIPSPLIEVWVYVFWRWPVCSYKWNLKILFWKQAQKNCTKSHIFFGHNLLKDNLRIIGRLYGTFPLFFQAEQSEPKVFSVRGKNIKNVSFSGIMADPGAPHQGDASHLSTGGGGHDQPGGPARSWNPAQSAHQIQWKPHLCE